MLKPFSLPYHEAVVAALSDLRTLPAARATSSLLALFPLLCDTHIPGKTPEERWDHATKILHALHLLRTAHAAANPALRNLTDDLIRNFETLRPGASEADESGGEDDLEQARRQVGTGVTVNESSAD